MLNLNMPACVTVIFMAYKKVYTPDRVILTLVFPLAPSLTV